MKRVVVTGMGLVTPLGVGVAKNWTSLTEGRSGISRIGLFDASEMASQIAGQVPTDFDPDQFIARKEQKKMDRFIVYAMAAADEAIKSSGWEIKTEEESFSTGVLVGSGIGGLPVIEDTASVLHERGPRRVSPFFVPASLINLAAGQISIQHGLRGPNHAVVTACASGTHAIGDAARLIQWGDADVMLAGGAEAAVCPLGIAGFSAARALSTGYNDTPEQASRPFDKGRDGFVIGEGAGILVLEELEHAKKRGATIHAEITGYGLSGDAFHMTSPSKDGNGAFRAMKMACARAEIVPEDLDYINAHGTSTPVGDMVEIHAIKRLFGAALSSVSISSTKSAIGHLLGAAGAVEAVYCILAMKHGILPPTLNLTDPEEECEGLDLVPGQAREKTIKTVMSNSFGFGGTNATLVMRQF